MPDRYIQERVYTGSLDGKPVVYVEYFGISTWDVRYPDSRLRYLRGSRTRYDYAGAKRFARRYKIDPPTPPEQLIAEYESEGSPSSHFKF